MSNMLGEFAFIDEKGHCGEASFKELFSSVAWQELEDTFNARLAMTRTDLECEDNEKEMYRLQGDARILRFVLALRSGILEEFEALSKDKDNEDD